VAQVLDLLVSNDERERVADDLRGHYEAGRLTLDEFQQRLDETHAARTEGQLTHALRQRFLAEMGIRRHVDHVRATAVGSSTSSAAAPHAEVGRSAIPAA
jgi:predicted secreted protein